MLLVQHAAVNTVSINTGVDKRNCASAGLLRCNILMYLQRFVLTVFRNINIKQHLQINSGEYFALFQFLAINDNRWTDCILYKNT